MHGAKVMGVGIPYTCPWCKSVRTRERPIPQYSEVLYYYRCSRILKLIFKGINTSYEWQPNGCKGEK